MSKEQRRIAYEQAIIKIADKLPELLLALHEHSKAMDNLARQMNLMPSSIRMRPF